MPRLLAAMMTLASSAFAFLALPSQGACGDVSRSADEPRQSSPAPAEKAPFRQLIEQVAFPAGIAIRGHELLDIEVPIPPHGLPVRARLRKLLAHVDHVLVEEMTPDGDLRPTHIVIVAPRRRRSHVVAERVALPEDRSGAPHQSPGLVETLLDGPDHSLRRWAIEQLGERNDEAAFPWLVGALDDKDPGVREAALGTLGQYGARVVELVASRLRDESVGQVRVAALEMLGQVGGARAVDLLAGVLDDRDIEVRIAAVEALGRISHPAATHVLLVMARTGEPTVRKAALSTLAMYAPETTAEAAVGQALGDEDETVNALAVDLSEAIRHRRLAAPPADRGK